MEGKYIEGMPVGPGKYDDELTKARKAANATGGLLVILDGDKGAGFSCQCPMDMVIQLPDILEQVAKQIRQDFN